MVECNGISICRSWNSRASCTSSLMMIWGLMTFGPRLANAGNLLTELLVNSVCIFVLMLLGCHNVVMFNDLILLLGYLRCMDMMCREGVICLGSAQWLWWPDDAESFFTETTEIVLTKEICVYIFEEFHLNLLSADLCDTWGFINYFSLWLLNTLRA